MAWINNIYNFWGTVLIVIVVIWLWRFWTGLKSRRDQRFRNLGFDGYKGYKQSSEIEKEKLKQDYREALDRGELLGTDYNPTAFRVGSYLEGKQQKRELRQSEEE